MLASAKPRSRQVPQEAFDDISDMLITALLRTRYEC